MCIVLVSLLILIPLSTGVLSQNVNRPLQVGNIDKGLVDGCGCAFRFRGTPERRERYIFFSSIEEQVESACMNIDGKDIKLKLVKSTNSNRKERVGTRSSMTYAGGDLTVRISMVATRVCKPNDENCESTDYSGTFVLRRRMVTRSIRAVGWCGC